MKMSSGEDRHRQVECSVCFKTFRSNNLKRHMRKHRDLHSLAEKDMREEIKARKRQYENKLERIRLVKEIAQQEEAPLECIEEIEKTNIEENLETEMLKDNQKYLDMIEYGKKVANILDKGIVREESLSKDRKQCLDLYRKQEPKFDLSSVQLRTWQQEAMEYFDSPTERQVIWIRGNNGNEGKSWFQNYVQSFFGYHRVFHSDLRIKHANICNVLKKRTLGAIDIFLFNDSRSVSGEELNLYRILEDIKDGQATTSKYDNDNIRFKTPNTVMVFSNHYPNLKKLSRDRWVLLHPNKDGLKDVLEIYKKNAKAAKERIYDSFDL